MTDYKDKIWFQFLDHSMRDLVGESYLLLDIFSRNLSAVNNPPAGGQVHDFSFIVFPLAKAYEGFLKKWLFVNHLIDEGDYRSDHFRLGKSLNPSIEKKFRGHDYVYDKIVANCSDPHLADRLWDAWKQCRNLVFHYFPDHQHFIATVAEAQARLDQLDSVMSEALRTKINRNY